MSPRAFSGGHFSHRVCLTSGTGPSCLLLLHNGGHQVLDQNILVKCMGDGPSNLCFPMNTVSISPTIRKRTSFKLLLVVEAGGRVGSLLGTMGGRTMHCPAPF